ncbi:imidazoleglycerol-phosphate dehydratase HisB [Candidatus Symbiobacter mobilis]|uniref:Imidazoleglycerol-phosphate dehydratase n=1 Tax=Candidatus Symbiobacter mobilis CR TaxID=946483 RepID=U5N671_9BURK|nr:imidazoleglycerol-phosphate dehydratase HisB [Candidatus Symbiobacter mobilis]AGX86842.1 imidazoleglycerol-phosphate dehydratase [Candidatus Symbiobacter mobilis CR]
MTNYPLTELPEAHAPGTGRTAEIRRNTEETEVSVRIQLQGSGQARVHTGVGFFDHMLEQFARHALVDLDIDAEGDLHVDAHHTVEDVGITLGQAVHQALGNKKGVRRFAHAYVPLDEALSRVVIDLSGRPGLAMDAEFTCPSVGGFDTQLVYEFFQGFVNHALVTLHVDNLKGRNAHHQIETIFKAFGRAFRDAVAIDARSPEHVPSTKGTL